MAPPKSRSKARKGAAKRSRRAIQSDRRATKVAVEIPADADDIEVSAAGHTVQLTNLRKVFWPELGLTKGDLLRYYAAMAPVLLPHLVDRAMVMKRYPNGIHGKHFFMKRVPSYRPDWLETCAITHGSGNVIHFPVVQDLAALMWIVNLGCIDLNPWYARCDDVDRPDFLHFDLDPVPDADFDAVLETALIVREALEALGMTAYAKTSGSKGVHVYVPIERGPLQKEVWAVAKELANVLAARNPDLITAEYRIAKRPKNHVLVDYNQNAWGRTLASIYAVRPRIAATVSAPISWDEVSRGVSVADFTIFDMVERVQSLGDLWARILGARGRFSLRSLLA